MPPGEEESQRCRGKSENVHPLRLPYTTTWRSSRDLLEDAWEARSRGSCLDFTVATFDLEEQRYREHRVHHPEPCDPEDPRGGPAYEGEPFPLTPPKGYLLTIRRGSTRLPLPAY